MYNWDVKIFERKRTSSLLLFCILTEALVKQNFCHSPMNNFIDNRLKRGVNPDREARYQQQKKKRHLYKICMRVWRIVSDFKSINFTEKASNFQVSTLKSSQIFTNLASGIQCPLLSLQSPACTQQNLYLSYKDILIPIKNLL